MSLFTRTSARSILGCRRLLPHMAPRLAPHTSTCSRPLPTALLISNRNFSSSSSKRPKGEKKETRAEAVASPAAATDSTTSDVDSDIDDTPNMIYYGLYSTVCYTGVYVGTLATLYVALFNGVLSAETFDIDQIESVAKMQATMGSVINVEDSVQLQQLADASMMNRYLKVPRVFMTTGVSLVMAKTFGMDLDKDEDGHKKIFLSLFALTLLEMDV